MKYDRFFKLAKENGISEAELYIAETSSLSFDLFHSEIDSYENNDSYKKRPPTEPVSSRKSFSYNKGEKETPCYGNSGSPTAKL